MTKTPVPIKDPKLIVAEAYDQIAELFAQKSSESMKRRTPKQDQLYDRR